MNPSYNSGSFNAGGNPGIIASTPDSALPEPQPMKLNGGARGGSRKGLVIGALLVVVVLVVVMVVVMVMPKGGGGANNSSDGAFNRLINYVTSGTESTADITAEYNVANDYYFLDGWDTEEEKAAIYAKTRELMDAFVAGYKDGDNEVLNNLVKEEKELFDFLEVIELKEEVIDADFMTIEDENDRKNLKANLMKYYDFSTLNDNPYMNSFKEIYSAWIDSVVNGTGGVSYRYIDNYYNKDDNFVLILYYINDLMHGKSISGVENEE